METVAASQLRSLVAAHDNAVIQIYILEKQVHSLMMKMVKQVDEGHIIHGIQLAQRRCIVEGVKQMFYMYQHRKWMEVQDCINRVTSQMTSQQWYPQNSNPQQLQLENHLQNVEDFPANREGSMQSEWQGHPRTEAFEDELDTMNVVVVEEDMEASFSSDSDTSMDTSYDDNENEDVHWTFGHDQYMETIIRGLCFENCELHRGA